MTESASTPLATAPQELPRISAVLIAANEAINIGACLDGLRWCDEIVVVISNSRDATAEIARASGARVVETPDWPGFGLQKQRALELATGDWILSIDADERVSSALRDEIRSTVAQAGANQYVYALPRLSAYCGRFIHHGGWWPDPVIRLAPRGAVRFSEDLVHERLLTTLPTHQLQSPLLHYSFRNFSDVLRKIDQYSELGAQQAKQRGKRATVGKALRHAMWAFFRTYLIKRSCLDGAQGLALAISNAEGVYYRYLKLWLLDQPNLQDPALRP